MFALTLAKVKDYTLCIKPRMRHGHRPGWENDEIYAFVNHILNGTEPLPSFGTVKVSDNKIRTKVRAAIPIKEAKLNYTTDTCELKSREWKDLPAGYRNGKIKVAGLPEGTTIWYLSVTDEKEHFVSSDIVFEK